ncbi:MAG: MoxR family ATPase [bacterium]|nr:MoxR family ATPase [bacterium]
MSDPPRFELVSLPGANHDHQAARARLAERPLPKAIHDLGESAPAFVPDDELRTAVNTALAVGSPLLLTGEPGTGKTQVAYYLGWYFGLPVHEFSVKSTSTAQDIKYDFDAVGYLRTAYGKQGGEKRPREAFLEKKALWLAYEEASDSVVLIDEIDKAPRDFPNDLLHELDQHSFKHPFEDREVNPISKRPPIVVITSNVERRLPDAFLRRTVFHHIQLTPELVEKAAKARRETSFPSVDDKTLTAALERFWELRAMDDLTKKPTTAELLVWLAVLAARDVDAAQLRDVDVREMPGINVLLKSHEDLTGLDDAGWPR